VPRSKNKWSYTSTPQYAFMAWCSVKAQGILTFTVVVVVVVIIIIVIIIVIIIIHPT
jgi:hypothetical protein